MNLKFKGLKSEDQESLTVDSILSVLNKAALGRSFVTGWCNSSTEVLLPLPPCLCIFRLFSKWYDLSVFAVFYLTVGGLMTQCSSTRAIIWNRKGQNMQHDVHHQSIAQDGPWHQGCMFSFICVLLLLWICFIWPATSSFSLQYSVIRATTWGLTLWPKNKEKSWKKFPTFANGKIRGGGGTKCLIRSMF